MRHATARLAPALCGLVLASAWSHAAFADVTLTGTVGEIGMMPGQLFLDNKQRAYVRFKFTDANQTAACTDQSGQQNGTTTKYAYFYNDDSWYREWYAALLVSKKGASLSCTVSNNQNCHVTSCTLP